MSSTLVVAPVKVYPGETVDLDIQVRDEATNEPLSIVGWHLWMTCKEFVSDLDANALFQYTEGSGIVVTDALNGVAVVSIPPSATVAFKGISRTKTLYLDLQGQDRRGKVRTLWSDTLPLSPTPTQATG